MTSERKGIVVGTVTALAVAGERPASIGFDE